MRPIGLDFLRSLIAPSQESPLASHPMRPNPPPLIDLRGLYDRAHFETASWGFGGKLTWSQRPTWESLRATALSTARATPYVAAYLGTSVAQGALPFPVGQAAYYATLAIGTKRFFGKETRDYVLASLMTNSTFEMARVALQPDADIATGLMRAGVLFFGGAFYVGWTNWRESHVKLGDLTVADLNRDHAAAETFATRMERDLSFAKSVRLLETRLKREGKLLSFFGYAPETFDLAAELKHLRVGKNNVATALAYYMAFTHSLFLPGVYPRFVVMHELIHALHHKAIMRTLTRADLERIPGVLDDDLRPSFIRDHLATVAAYLENSTDGDVIPEKVAWAAADLFFYRGLRRNKAVMEAIGSYYDVAAGGPLSWAWRLTEKLMYISAWPFAKLAGIHESNGMIQTHRGYSNPWLLKRVRELGLIGSMKTPFIPK